MIAVYFYFLSCLFARQFKVTGEENNETVRFQLVF